MIICSCRAVSDRALRDAAAAGLSRAQVAHATGAGTDCGHCRDAVADIVAEARGPCRGAETCPGWRGRPTA